MRGARFAFSGTASKLDADAVTTYRTALIDGYGLTAVGTAVVRTGKNGPVAALLFDEGLIVLRKRGERLLITLEMDGTPNVSALEKLTVATFGLTDYLMLRDTTNL